MAEPERHSVWDIVAQPGVYQALEKIAHQHRLRWADLSWWTDELANEALLRMTQQERLPPREDRAAFERAFAVTLKRVLADKYDRKTAKKRGGRWVRQGVLRLLGLATPSSDARSDLMGLVEHYVHTRPLHAVIVWMTAEFGLTTAEIADVLGLQPESVERKLRLARAELRGEVEPRHDP